MRFAMLRQLSRFNANLASVSYGRNSISQIAREGRRTLATGSKDGEKKIAAPKIGGDREYVKRRLKYRYELHDFRMQFKKELKGGEQDVGEWKRKDRERELETKRAREERKRKKSVERNKNVEELLRDIKEGAAKRNKVKREIWEMKQSELESQRRGDLEVLINDAGNWVTEGKLEEEIEKVVDAFFIEDNNNNEGKGKKKEQVKVVGW